MSIIYAGIGSRQTPTDVLSKMRNGAKALAKANATLRTGGAKGADQSFYEGWKDSGKDSLIEVYLPFIRFNGFECDNERVFGPPTKEARMLAKEFHPNWANVGDSGRDFHARNCYQVLGYDLKTPCDFVLCWTPNGKVIGGTGQALRLAEKYEIPVLNFAIHSDEYISDFIFSQLEKGN